MMDEEGESAHVYNFKDKETCPMCKYVDMVFDHGGDKLVKDRYCFSYKEHFHSAFGCYWQYLFYSATYDPDYDDFSIMLSLGDVQEMVAGKIDTTYVNSADPPYDLVPMISSDEVRSSVVKKYRLKEEWFFDRQRSVVERRVLGICPVVEADLLGPAVGIRGAIRGPVRAQADPAPVDLGAAVVGLRAIRVGRTARARIAEAGAQAAPSRWAVGVE